MSTIIAGCGFGGAVVARQLAEANEKVRIIERRNHIGGNCYDEMDAYGILIHTYGPHIFHTKIKEVYEYLSRFTEWYPYQHEVVANIYGKLVPVPFNLHSIAIVFGKEKAERMRSVLLKEYGKNARIPILQLRQHENTEIQELGNYVYENIFLKYTMKQWNQRPEEVDQSVTARVPVLISEDDRYFQDPWQGMPKEGYTKLFERLLDHPNIEIELGKDIRDIMEFDFHKKKIYIDKEEFNGNIIYTGMVDELLAYKLGHLPYRSLNFDFEHKDMEYYQSKGVVNYTVSEDYTRITECKYLTGQKCPSTTIIKEYPIAYKAGESEPYYAILSEENKALHKQYEDLLSDFGNFYLLGRLAQYRYYDMDAIVKEALDLAEKLKGER